MSTDPFAAVEQLAVRQQQSETAARAIRLARSALVLGRDAKAAFFASLALRLIPEEDRHCSTMETDGRVLAYNPDFVVGLTPEEQVGVLVHEVMHIALSHPFRRGTRDATRWNIACDLAINPLILAAGLVLPPGRLVPGEAAYAHLPPGKSAEDYYVLLGHCDRPGPESDASGDRTGAEVRDPGGCGGVRQPGDGSPAEVRQAEAECQAAVAQAEQVARARGELPGGLARSVDQTLRPAADWRAILRSFVHSQARNDYSWSRPNRRYLGLGWFLPGIQSDSLGEVVLAVDTSGSVGPRELGLFATEANAVLEAFDCTLTVVYHDTAVQRVSTWTSRDGPLTLDPTGGGGTSHVCVFDWLQTAAVNPACVICLTDLETVFPETPPPVEVLWAVVGGSRTVPPFGQFVAVGP